MPLADEIKILDINAANKIIVSVGATNHKMQVWSWEKGRPRLVGEVEYAAVEPLVSISQAWSKRT